MTSESPSKSIFEYGDYRELLKDLFQKKKSQDKKFSYRYFSKTAGFVSHSFLRFVMEGKSDLSEESIQKFIKGFKFNKEEGHFFRHLVLLNQVKSSVEKQIHIEEILRCQSYRKFHPLSEAQYQLYSQWYFIPVREIVNFPDFVEDPEWIANRVIPKIRAEQALVALVKLQELGLLVRNEAGKLIQSDPILTTPNEVLSTAVAQWHRGMMERASESIDTVSRERRDISAVTLGLTREGVQQVKEMIQNFRKELMGAVTGQSPVKSVYQLNLQFFPLAGEEEGAPNEKINDEKK